jgi:hypothetical protein
VADQAVLDYDGAVEKSFRDDAIRTAVLIDDQFPDYVQAQSKDAGKFKESPRAQSIYSFMHKRGLICDVMNGDPNTSPVADVIDKARKSDLVVLDYKLQDDEPDAALDILRQLAVTDHFNMVVIYTADEPKNVALAAAAAMKGQTELDDKSALSAGELVAAGDFLEQENQEIDHSALRASIVDGEVPKAWKKEFVGRAVEAGVKVNPSKLCEYVRRSWLKQLVGDYQFETETLSARASSYDAEEVWVQCGSCFVALVKKANSKAGDDEGDLIWQKLGAALRAWRPNFYRLLLSDIQNALEQETIADHDKWLADDLCVGLGLYLLPSEDIARDGAGVEESRGLIEELIDRFVDMIRHRLSLHKKIAVEGSSRLSALLGEALKKNEGESARYARARQLAHWPDGVEIDWYNRIVPRVNAFMVSDDYRGTHITTGSVLYDSNADRYWLCVSPSCDMVPRGADQSRLVQVIQLNPANEPHELVHGDRIVIMCPEGPKILRVLAEETRQPSLHAIFFPAGTKTKIDEASEYSIIDGLAGSKIQDLIGAAAEQTAQPALAPVVEGEAPEAGPNAAEHLKLTNYKVVSQLRSSFALKLLHVTGHHLSRVGVDFVDADGPA